MSWEDVEYRCGCAGQIQVYGPRRDRERKAAWLASNRSCEACFRDELEKKREADLASAKESAAEWELPPLQGTEKQVAWAEQIRGAVLKLIEKISEKEASPENDPEGILGEGVTIVLGRDASRFWIDTMRRYEHPLLYGKLCEFLREKGRSAREAEAIVGPTVVTPVGLAAISIVEISHEPGEVRLKTQRKEDESFITEVKDIGFRWSGTHWAFDCLNTPVALDNVAAGIASEILDLGYSVALQQPTVVELVERGGFERDPVRKLLAAKGNKSFLFWWRRSDDIFDTLKTLPGARWDSPYMRVPATSVNEVLDLAAQFGFWIDPLAAALAESVNTVEVKGEKVVLGLPTTIGAAQLTGEIHADLRD